jgi:heme ABC exporter ATP-binding subunit CcmA
VRIDSAQAGPTGQAMPSDSPQGGIEVVGLRKSFGPLSVLRRVDFAVLPGERVLLVGPNGAGKTTFIRILATLLRPTAGYARVAGFDPVRQPDMVRRCVGLVGHQTFLYGELTVSENLAFYARMYGVEDGERCRELLSLVGLSERAGKQARTLSRGMQQRLALARVVLHRPAVLLLDEPDAGLDQQGVTVLDGMLRDATESGCAILFTSHNLQWGLDMASRVAVLSKGRIVFQAPRERLNAGDFEEAYRRHIGAAS